MCPAFLNLKLIVRQELARVPLVIIDQIGTAREELSLLVPHQESVVGGNLVGCTEGDIVVRGYPGSLLHIVAEQR